jgi:hypothetical protein
MQKKVKLAARLKYGCRILQRFLEHCREDQLHEIIEEIFADAIALSGHPYGSYVMQHLVENGTNELKRRLMELFRNHVDRLNYDGITCGVIGRAFEHAATKDTLACALQIIQVDGLIVRISLNRQGHLIAKSILRLVEDDLPVLESAVAQLRAAEPKLQATRYGRAVLNVCQKSSQLIICSKN